MPAADSQQRATLQPFPRYFLAAGAWLAACLFLARLAVHTGSPWPALLAALALAVPTAGAALYARSVKLIHRAALYQPGGWLRRLRTGRLLAGLLCILVALLAGAASVPWLASLGPAEVAALFLAAALFHPLVRLAAALTRREMAPFVAHATALGLARVLLTVPMAAFYLLAPLVTAAPEPPPALAGTFREISLQDLDPGGSYLMQLAARAAEYLHGTRAYLLQHAASSRPLFLAALTGAALALSFNVSLLLSGWLIPAREYRRIFVPLEPTASPPPVPVGTTVSAAALVALLVLSLLPLLAAVEQRLRRDQRLEEIVPRGEALLLRYAERIDGVLYEPGTLDAIAAARLDALGAQQRALEAVRDQGKRAFAAMRGNVDRYLDWYYSLPAEYLRLVGAASGNLEEQLREDLERTLAAGGEVAALDRVAAKALADYPALAAAFSRERDAILARNRLDGDGEPVRIVEAGSLDALAAPGQDAVLLDLEARLALSGAGGVGAVLASQVAAKVAAKGGLKLAAKALGKVATSKAVSWAGGAATGAAVGSVVPGIGTLAGAAVGAAAGVVLGISVDALLLKLEENHSREAFRRQLIDAIDAQEREFLALFERLDATPGAAR